MHIILSPSLKRMYEVLPMGIMCAPKIWMDYITLILQKPDFYEPEPFNQVVDVNKQ